MITPIRLILTLFVLSIVAGPAQASGGSGAVREWNFRVLMDNADIGYHNFRLTEEGADRYLESEASFDVRFLFITAFSYRHSNTEKWSGECLEQIETATRANGRELSLEGRRDRAGFIVDSGGTVSELPACVMTFAYWNPDFLKEPRLLNPQTGEYVEVSVEDLDEEVLVVRGEETLANRFRLTARGMKLDLWYSQQDGEWLALESVAKGGRIIRYELT